MIGKPQWFTYRILGWGIRPRTKEGYIYLAIGLAIFAAIFFSYLSETAKIIGLSILIGIIFIDSVHIMSQLGKVHDEREKFQQLIIEKNVSYATVGAILLVAFYQTYQNKALLTSNQIPFDISLLIILGVMVLTKAISTFYVNKKL